MAITEGFLEPGSLNMPINLTLVAVTDDGTGKMLCTKASHGLQTDYIVYAQGGSYLANVYKITKISDDSFLLEDSTYISNQNITVNYVAGSTWATAINPIGISAANGMSAIGYKAPKSKMTDLGISASFVKDSSIITLASALTKVVDDAIGNTWSVVAGVTGGSSTATAYRYLGASAQMFTMTTAMTQPGKIAYKTFAGTEDFSGFTKLSFWIATSRYNQGMHVQGSLKICLCSDDNGDVIVNELPLYQLGANSRNHSMVLDYGGALGSNIKSVAIYCTATIFTTTGTILYINNIVACNELTHETAVGGNSGNNVWYAIMAINGVQLTIQSTASTSGICVEESFSSNIFAISPYIYEYIISNTGQALILPLSVEVIFGYDKITGIRDGIFYIRSRTQLGGGIQIVRKKRSNVLVSNFKTIQNSIPIEIVDNVYGTACDGGIDFAIADSSSTSPVRYQNIVVHNTGGNALSLISDYSHVYNSTIFGTVYSTGTRNIIVGSFIESLMARCDIKLYDCTVLYWANSRRWATVYYYNCLLPALNGGEFDNSNMFVFNYNKTEGANFFLSRNLLVSWQTTVKRTGTNGSWMLQSNSADFAELVSFPIAEILVEGGKPFTFRIWMMHNGYSSTFSLVVFDNYTGIETKFLLDVTTEWKEFSITIEPEKTQVLSFFIKPIAIQSTLNRAYIGSISQTVG